jgi:hypothetical protein
VSLIITDALEVVDDVGWHRSNLLRRAFCQLLRVAVNAVASAEVVELIGDDAAVAVAAAIATATAQVEPSTSSSLPIL